jgi:hypothetical protein
MPGMGKAEERERRGTGKRRYVKEVDREKRKNHN